MKIFSENIIKIKNKFYLFARDVNLFYSIDFIDGQVSFISTLPEEQLLSERLVSEVIYWENKFYFIPFKAKNLWIYSMINESWEKVEIKDYKNNWANAYFRNGVIYKDFLYMFGGYYTAIVKLNLQTKEVSYIEEPFKRKVSKKMKDAYFRGKPLQIGNILYLASCIDNTVLVFNLEDENFQWVEVGSKENCYSGIEKNGSNFWLSPRHNTSIVKWDGHNAFVEYKLDKNKVLQHFYYSGIIKRKNDFLIYTFGNKVNSIIVKNNGEIFFENCRYTFCEEIEGEYVYQCLDGKIYYLDINGQIRIYENEIESNKAISLLKEIDNNIDRNIRKKRIYYEGQPFLCNEWLSILFGKEKNFEYI